MPTDYRELPPDLLEAFESAYAPSDDAGVRAEIEALEHLFGCPMPAEIERILEVERDPILAPSPVTLVGMEHPFEALILRAQELDDCVPVLFPLTGSVYLRRFRGAELLGHVHGAPGRPVMPFVGWQRDKWAYDLPTVLQLAKALHACDAGDEEEAERLVEPIWGRILRTEYTDHLFYALEDSGAADRLQEGWGDRADLRRPLRQWWRHERALFFGFALMGKFRTPEKDAFTNDPNKGLANEHLLSNLGLQMSLLWRGWFLPEGDLLERAMAATESSPSRLVQDARRLIAELLDGRTTIGTVDMHEARARYKGWVEDPEAHRIAKRARRRETLEHSLEPSEHGIALVRAEWPLAAEVRSEPQVGDRAHTWDPHTRLLTVTGAGDRVEHSLVAPDEASKIYLARNTPLTELSPSGRRFTCSATVHRPKRDKSGWENAPVLVEHDLDAGTWRVLVDAPKVQWLAAIADDRWLTRDNDSVTLLRDLGSELDAKYTAFAGQPHAAHIPELGVVIAYGSTALVDGRSPDDAKAAKVRVFGYWRERLALLAAFAIDGVELVAERSDNGWKVGLVSAGREVAWELRGLPAGVEAWRSASQTRQREEQAQREAFGEITIDRAVQALNTFVGTDYSPEYQEGLDAVFAAVLDELRMDAAAVAAAKSATTAVEFASVVKGPFATAMSNSGRGPAFLDFALKCSILSPAYADIVVRAAATSAWRALREG